MHKSRQKYLKIDFFFIYKNTIITMTTRIATKTVMRAPFTQATWFDVMEFNWEHNFYYYLGEDEEEECLFNTCWKPNPFNIIDNVKEELHAYMDNALDSSLNDDYQDWLAKIQQYMEENDLKVYTKRLEFEYTLLVEGVKIEKKCCRGEAVFEFEGGDLVNLWYEIE